MTFAPSIAIRTTYSEQVHYKLTVASSRQKNEGEFTENMISIFFCSNVRIVIFVSHLSMRKEQDMIDNIFSLWMADFSMNESKKEGETTRKKMILIKSQQSETRGFWWECVFLRTPSLSCFSFFQCLSRLIWWQCVEKC